MTARRGVLTLATAAAAVSGAWWLRQRFVSTTAPGDGGTTRAAARVVPEGTRIRVEVLNATDTRGLARQAMFVLRDAGFDVVYFGTTAERTGPTLVRDRSGHGAWAQLAARTMAPSNVETKPDSSHFLDLTVLVGSSWVPPRRSLYP